MARYSADTISVSRRLSPRGLRPLLADVDDPLLASSNVPGVSLYFLTLSRLRTFVGQFPQFRAKGAPLPTNAGGKVKLTTAGDLLVGSTARTGVGFILMPFTLLKTLSEVCWNSWLGLEPLRRQS